MALNPRIITHDSKAFVRKIAITGQSGAGKTRLIGTAQDVPAMRDVYHLDMDAGTATLKSRGDIQGEATTRAIDVESVLNAFLNREPATMQYKTVVADGLSKLLKREFEEMLKAKGKDATYKEYGKIATLGVRLINLISDLPVTTIINVWSKTVQPMLEGTAKRDENAAPSIIQPDVPNGAMNSFLGACDDVFYIHATDDRTRYLYTDKTKLGSMTVIAKMRDEMLAPEFCTEINGKSYPIIKNPTFPDLFERYQRGFAKFSK